MTYTVKRISTKSAAKVAFVCLFIVTIPMIPAFWSIGSMSTFSFGETPPAPNLAPMLGALAVPLLYGAMAALGAAIVTFVYNIGGRFHGGIKIDIELQETADAFEKKKN
jgi:hypothetical protein